MSKSDKDMFSGLFEAAKLVRNTAYAPYSNFHVGVALVDENNIVHSACNVENAAYPQGVCAEAGAISMMVATGARKIEQICIVGSGSQLVTPCGGCRQKIREFATDNTQIHICDENGLRKSFSLAELLPFSFGPDNLED